MPLYMTQFSYTAKAAAAMAQHPQDRSLVLKQAVEKLGGQLLGLYYCFGEYDGVVIAEMPDQTAELALILAVTAPGHLKATKTTVLITMDEAVDAMGRARGLAYAGPEG